MTNIIKSINVPFYLKQMSIPIDCVRLIIAYAQLKERFAWSVVHRQFVFVQKDWDIFARVYKTRTPTREDVKEICQRHFDAHFLFKQCERHVWSFHLNEPLCLWTPWTLGKFCKRYNKVCSMTFRNFAFIDFVRNLTAQFGLKLNHLTEQNLRILIFKKKIPMVYIYKQKRIKKLHISSAFKTFDLARVFVSFHLYDKQLTLRPRRLEFVVS
jgi:hypothetical protein